MTDKRLGEILQSRKTVTEVVLNQAAKSARAQGKKLGEELLMMGAVSEHDLYAALAEQKGLRFGSVDRILESLDRELMNRVPRPYLEHTGMVPVSVVGKKALIATSNPHAAVEDLARVLGATEWEAEVITPSDMRRIWTVLDLGAKSSVMAASADQDDLGDTTFRSRMVALFEGILVDAIGGRASDIHFERYEDSIRLRYRVDGNLHDVTRFSMNRVDLNGVVNVVKIASNIDITEKRLPQGGRIRRRLGKDVFDLRVQTQPCLHGEHLIIRILPQRSSVLTVEDLGFPSEEADKYRRLLDSPQGLVLVVGPTGSGKSTTLYAGLQLLAADSTRKVITVEDPIEYSLRGIQQTQVHPEIGFSFAHAMRAFVREDPDVILVGEIRDGETALEAIRASQTGHLVLSTLHCNDSVDAVQRLLDLGMHPNSISSELIAVIAQRLVRKNCEVCKVPVVPDPEILKELFPTGAPDHFRCWAGQGCDHCGGTGTRGRIATFELLRVNATLRKGIAHKLTVDDLRQLAWESGLKPIRNHLIELVLSGITPLDEVPATLSIEQMAPHTQEEGI
jgi:type IV pilus assembly protein PilB